MQSVGTAASLGGVATVLKRYNPKIKIIAVEPEESCVLSGGKPGAHDIEGIGIGYTPPLWDTSLVDEILSVKTTDAKDMARAANGSCSIPDSASARASTRIIL